MITAIPISPIVAITSGYTKASGTPDTTAVAKRAATAFLIIVSLGYGAKASVLPLRLNGFRPFGAVHLDIAELIGDFLNFLAERQAR